MPRTYQVLFALAGKSTPCPGSAQEYAAAAWPANPVRALADAIRGLGHRVSLVGTGSRADDGASGTIAGRQADAPACDVVVVVPQDARSVAGWPRDVTTARWRILWLDRAELARGSGPSRVRLCLRGVGPPPPAVHVSLGPRVRPDADDRTRRLSIDGTKALLTEHAFSVAPPSHVTGTRQRPVLPLGPQVQLALFPGLAILLLVLGINLVGDWLRDLLDPRMERGM